MGRRREAFGFPPPLGAKKKKAGVMINVTDDGVGRKRPWCICMFVNYVVSFVSFQFPLVPKQRRRRQKKKGMISTSPVCIQ